MTASRRDLMFGKRFLLVLILMVGPARAYAAQLWGIDSSDRHRHGSSGDPCQRTYSDSPRRRRPRSASGLQPNRLWAIRWNVNGSRLQSFNPFSAKVITDVLVDAPTRVLGLAIDAADGTIYGNTETDLYKINPLPAGVKPYERNAYKGHTLAALRQQNNGGCAAVPTTCLMSSPEFYSRPSSNRRKTPPNKSSSTRIDGQVACSCGQFCFKPLLCGRQIAVAICKLGRQSLQS
jgi:hypothetical protein